MGTETGLLVLLVCACFVRGTRMELSANCFRDPTTFSLIGRIVNGTKATLGQFPHQVSLKRSWSESHFCGGSIISDRLVVTAAHCMYLSGNIIEPWTILVVGGELKLFEITPKGQRRNVNAINIHPQFNNRTLQNDIAILELAIPFALTPEVHSAPLPTSGPIPEKLCTVAGWGYPSNEIPIVTPELMYVALPIRKQKECRELLVNVTKIYPGMFCAGFLKGGKDACQGDSGGGMVCDGVLTGVVSGGEGCASPRLPGVYSDTFYYRDWIASHMNANETWKGRGARKTTNIRAVGFFLVLSILIGP